MAKEQHRHIHKDDVDIIEAKTASEAVNFLFIGLKYFLMKHTLKTILILGLMMSGPAYIAWQYYTSDKVNIKEAVPLQEAKPIGALALFSDVAYAEPAVLGNSIIINGKVYGYADTTIQIWKLKNSDAILIHDKNTNRIWQIEIPSMRSADKSMKW